MTAPKPRKSLLLKLCEAVAASPLLSVAFVTLTTETLYYLGVVSWHAHGFLVALLVWRVLVWLSSEPDPNPGDSR